MRTQAPESELLGVLAEVLQKDDWEQCSWLGPEAWQPCLYEVAGGLWMEEGEFDGSLGVRVAQQLQRRFVEPVPVVSARRVLPGQGTILVWYRHLN